MEKSLKQLKAENAATDAKNDKERIRLKNSIIELDKDIKFAHRVLNVELGAIAVLGTATGVTEAGAGILAISGGTASAWTYVTTTVAVLGTVDAADNAVGYAADVYQGTNKGGGIILRCTKDEATKKMIENTKYVIGILCLSNSYKKLYEEPKAFDATMTAWDTYNVGKDTVDKLKPKK
jgi:hypothetical protein